MEGYLLFESKNLSKNKSTSTFCVPLQLEAILKEWQRNFWEVLLDWIKIQLSAEKHYPTFFQ